jgi:xylulokinase
MAARIVVTVDIGGSGVKASAYDVARGKNIVSVAERYPPAGHSEAQGTFSPDQWWLSVVASCRAITDLTRAAGRDYLGITVSAIRIPFVLLDRQRDVVMPGLLNRDRRAAKYVNDLIRVIGERALYETTGHWPAPEFGLPKLLWTRAACPDAWRATDRILQLHDWIIFRLSGAVASERSSAAMSQLLDMKAGSWAVDLLSEAGIPLSLLPELSTSGAPAGGISSATAAQTGLPRGLPVHLGGGDTHLSAMAAGGFISAAPVVVAGTTGPVQVAVPRGKNSQEFGHYYPLLVSEQPLSGNRVLESNAGPTGEIVDRLDGLSHATGDALRAALVDRGFMVVPAAAGGPVPALTVLAGNPFFGPDGWKEWPPPTVIGLRPGDTGVDVGQAGLRGTCLAFASVLSQLRDRMTHAPDAVIATGGMSRNRRWNAMLAAATGLPVRVRPLDRVAGLAGAALVAGANVLGALEQIESTDYRPEPRAGTTATDLAGYLGHYRAAQRLAAAHGAGSGAGPH